MASVPVVMQRVRRARWRSEGPRSVGRFADYEREYEAIFTARDDHCDEAALEAVAEWTPETTRDEQRLPAPAAVRARAREVCDDRGVTVPQDSPLAG